MITAEFIRSKGKTIEEYLDSIKDKYKDRWMKKIDRVEFTVDHIEFLKRKFLSIQIVAISADWCPDCQNSIPILIELARTSDYIDLILFDRDSHIDEFQNYKTNGGIRIPFVLFTNEKSQEIIRWVERSTISYELLLEAKIEAIEEDIDDYGKLMRQKFSEFSNKRFQDNIEEIFGNLKKAVYIRNSSAKLDELKKLNTKLQ